MKIGAAQWFRFTANTINERTNQTRNWALFKAEELIKEDSSSRGKEVKVNITSREVKVDGVLAFNQDETDLRGSFLGSFIHLQLP